MDVRGWDGRTIVTWRGLHEVGWLRREYEVRIEGDGSWRRGSGWWWLHDLI
jgi:hypothetical protein